MIMTRNQLDKPYLEFERRQRREQWMRFIRWLLVSLSWIMLGIGIGYWLCGR